MDKTIFIKVTLYLLDPDGTSVVQQYTMKLKSTNNIGFCHGHILKETETNSLLIRFRGVMTRL